MPDPFKLHDNSDVSYAKKATRSCHKTLIWVVSLAPTQMRMRKCVNLYQFSFALLPYGRKTDSTM